MEAQTFLKEKQKYVKKYLRRFPEKERADIEQKIMAFNEEDFTKLKNVKIFSVEGIDWVSWLIGEFGVDRFIIGDKKNGIIKLCLCWSIIPWFVDSFFLIRKATRNVNLKNFNTAFNFTSKNAGETVNA